jgi:hypothetical protein
MNSLSDDRARVWRGRLILIGLFALFFGTVGAAGILRFSGWQPQGSKVHGRMFEPAVDARRIVPRLADGGDYAWNPDARTWRIVVAPRPGCGAECVAMARDLDKVWRLFSHNADRVHILWIGTPPAGVQVMPALRAVADDAGLRALLPGVDDPTGVPVYVIDPNGFVILRYAPGADPGWIRADVAKLLKLM